VYFKSVRISDSPALKTSIQAPVDRTEFVSMQGLHLGFIRGPREQAPAPAKVSTSGELIRRVPDDLIHAGDGREFMIPIKPSQSPDARFPSANYPAAEEWVQVVMSRA
jgi:hypothetical protein